MGLLYTNVAAIFVMWPETNFVDNFVSLLLEIVNWNLSFVGQIFFEKIMC